jgi:hypothetical protein
MTIIAMPASVRVRSAQWSLDRPAQVNRSAYSGARRVVANPWHGKWSASVEVVPLVGEANVRAWRAFLASLKGQINTFQLPATEGPQHSMGPSTASAGASQGATAIVLAAAPTLGSELLTNGSFATTSSWTLTSGASISGGLLTYTGAASAFFATQNLVLANATYRVTIVVSAVTSGTGLRVAFNGTMASPAAALTTPGTYFFDIATTSATTFDLQCDSFGFNGSIDSVSVKQVLSTGVPPLTAGMLAEVTLPSGNHQLVMLTQDISGSTITFEPPLREAISSGAAVNHASPTCMVALADSAFGWSVAPGTQYGISFNVEEAF